MYVPSYGGVILTSCHNYHMYVRWQGKLQLGNVLLVNKMTTHHAHHSIYHCICFVQADEWMTLIRLIRNVVAEFTSFLSL